MSCHEQLPHEQQMAWSISDKRAKAVGITVSRAARPEVTAQACLKVERVPRKLRRQPGQRNLKTQLRKWDGQRHPPESASASLLPEAKRCWVKKLASQSPGTEVHKGASRCRRRNQGSTLDTCQGEAEEDANRSWMLPDVAEKAGIDDNSNSTGERQERALAVLHALIADTNERMRAENRQLNCALHELNSERVRLNDEIANLRQASQATESTLVALWDLSKPHFPGCCEDDVVVRSAAEVADAVARLGRLEGAPKDKSSAELERERAQRVKSLEHYRRAEAVARRNVHRLTRDKKEMQARLRKGEASRRELQARTEGAEQKYRRVEASILKAANLEQARRIILAEPWT